MITVEICVETIPALRAAEAAGADRVELCACLDVGGLTPSQGLMRLAAEHDIPARVLIRPRAGGFVYDADELAIMAGDIAAARALGLAGVVLGAVRPDGRLDREALMRLLEACEGLATTLHRAFDLTPDPFESLEAAAALGFDAILTSGQAPSAIDGAALLAGLTAQAQGRIAILAGGGIRPGNVEALVRVTGVPGVHASCRRSREAPDPAADLFGFGQDPRGPDAGAMRRLADAARRAAC
jgi:copper homeostasis protein